MTAQHNSIALEKAIRGESMYSNKINSHVMKQPHGVSSNVKIITTNNETIDMREVGNCPALHHLAGTKCRASQHTNTIPFISRR